MKLRILSFCAVALVCASSAWAENWSKTYQLNGKPTLHVETSDANIIVKTWDQNSIETNVLADGWKIGEGGLKVIESQAGDAVSLEVRFPQTHSVMHKPRQKVDIEIQMPREGVVALRTGDGNVSLGRFKGDVELASGDGNLSASGIEGPIKLHTGDGQIVVDGKFTALDISTGDGNVEARAEDGSSLGSGWDLKSGDGNITLEVPSTIAADLELRTGDGHITADLPVTMEGRIGDNHINGKINGGGAPLRVHTGDGSIHLKKTGAV